MRALTGPIGTSSGCCCAGLGLDAGVKRGEFVKFSVATVREYYEVMVWVSDSKGEDDNRQSANNNLNR